MQPNLEHLLQLAPIEDNLNPPSTHSARSLIVNRLLHPPCPPWWVELGAVDVVIVHGRRDEHVNRRIHFQEGGDQLRVSILKGHKDDLGGC